MQLVRNVASLQKAPFFFSSPHFGLNSKSANHFFGEPEIVLIPFAFVHSLMLTDDMQHS